MRAFAAGLAVLLLLGVIALVVARGGSRSPAAVIVPEATTTPTAARSEGAEPTLTALPPPTFADLPVPRWELLDPANLSGEWTTALDVALDVQTGRMAALVPVDARSSDPYARGVSLVGWTATGEALVTTHLPGNEQDLPKWAIYVGRPLEPLKPLAVVDGYFAVSASPDGLLALAGNRGAMVIDPATGNKVYDLPAAPPLPSFLDGWSADATHLLVGLPSFTDSEFGIWNRRDGSVVSLKGWTATWSSSGHQVAYDFHKGGEDELRVYDLASGESRTLAPNAGVMGWSPDDRYVVASVPSGFAVLEVASGRRVVTVTAAFYGGWLDAQTLYFIPDACYGDHNSMLTVETLEWRDFDYANLVGQPLHPSPDGSILAFGTMVGDEQGVGLLDLPSGRTTKFRGGDFNLSNLSPWSPDGLYLGLSGPIGRDSGLCFPLPPAEKTTVERN